MFTNILVALDGSDASQRALIRAIDEARVWNANIQAIYVVEPILFASLTTGSTLEMDNAVELMYRALEKEGGCRKGNYSHHIHETGTYRK